MYEAYVPFGVCNPCIQGLAQAGCMQESSGLISDRNSTQMPELTSKRSLLAVGHFEGFKSWQRSCTGCDIFIESLSALLFDLTIKWQARQSSLACKQESQVMRQSNLWFNNLFSSNLSNHRAGTTISNTSVSVYTYGLMNLESQNAGIVKQSQIMWINWLATKWHWDGKHKISWSHTVMNLSTLPVYKLKSEACHLYHSNESETESELRFEM